MNNNPNRGAPRGRSLFSGGNRRATRDALRAYERFNDQQSRRDWAYEPAPFDQTRVVNRRPTARSSNFKPKKPAGPEVTVTPDTVEDKMRDEPLYDIGPHSSLIPSQDVYCQNFDYSGFIPIVNETFEKMRGADPRLHERLPLSMFTHAMATHLNLEILEMARKSGQNVLNLRTDAREILPDYQVVPQPISDYISHISSVITQDGKEIQLNLPEVAIPQGPITVNGHPQPSGSFGVINASNHNAYECYVSPLVTSRRVVASQLQDSSYLPLPDDLIPGQLVPNRNLLGFEPIDTHNAGSSSRLVGIDFPDDDTLEGRYKYSQLLHNRVYVVLAEMKDRFKMVEFRREQGTTGLNILKHLVHKVTSVNLTFVESTGPINDAQTPLFLRNVAVHSFGAQGSAVANQANIECFHRRRVAGPPHARGFCCTTTSGQGPGGWSSTLNHNFTMSGLFTPVLHADYPPIRETHFSSHSSAGVRTNALGNFIERNYYIKR